VIAHFDFSYYIVRIVIGFFIGIALGMTGVGGGVLVMPALTILLTMPPSVAVGTASFYSFLARIYAVFEHHRLKNIQWNLSFWVLAGAFPGNILCSFIVLHFANSGNAVHSAHFQNTLKNIIVWIMILSAVIMIANLFSGKKKTNIPAARGTHVPDIHMNGVRIFQAIISGFIIGCLMGTTSVGAGILLVPLLVILFKMSARKTIGASIFIAVVLALVTSIIYAKGGNLDYSTGICMWAGSLAGVFLGSRWSTVVPDTILKLIIVIIILFAVSVMFLGPAGH
jgi:uncharacterized membrane protein YfcA